MKSPKSKVQGPKSGGPGEMLKAESRNCEGGEAFISKDTVAERLDVEIRTVTRLMRRGVLRYYRVGWMVRFKWSEVESDMREHLQVFDPNRPPRNGQEHMANGRPQKSDFRFQSRERAQKTQKP
jgi:excisionase family DNA binding protein